MRKTIYVPSEGVWDGVKEKAKDLGLSVSVYLLGGNHNSSSQLDRIESKIDKLAWNNLKTRTGMEPGPPPVDVPKKNPKMGEHDRTDAGPNVQVDMAELERVNRKIKSKPIVSYSKDRQLGKKGGK